MSKLGLASLPITIAALVFACRATASSLGGQTCDLRDGRESLVPARVFCGNRLFVRSAWAVASKESQIPADPRFSSFQKMTLRWQGYLAREVRMGDFARMTIVQPESVRFEVLQRAIVRYQTDYKLLIGEIFDHIKLHTLLNQDLNRRSEYLREIISAIEIIASPLSEKGYEPLSCDYVSQPLNALWFFRHSLPRLYQLRILSASSSPSQSLTDRLQIEDELRRLVVQLQSLHLQLSVD